LGGIYKGEGVAILNHNVNKIDLTPRSLTYEAFDANRRQAEALAADAEDIKALEEIEKKAEKKMGDA
jgi:hypothetical protein